MNPRLITLGSLFLFASSVITFETGIVTDRLLISIVAIASLVLALGSVTVGTLRSGRSI